MKNNAQVTHTKSMWAPSAFPLCCMARELSVQSNYILIKANTMCFLFTELLLKQCN